MPKTAEMGEVGMTSGNHWSMKRKVMSIVEDQGVNSSTCGYCKGSTPTSVAQGAKFYPSFTYYINKVIRRCVLSGNDKPL